MKNFNLDCGNLLIKCYRLTFDKKQVASNVGMRIYLPEAGVCFSE